MRVLLFLAAFVAANAASPVDVNAEVLPINSNIDWKDAYETCSARLDSCQEDLDEVDLFAAGSNFTVIIYECFCK